MQILIVTILTILLAFFSCIVMQHSQLYYNFVQVTYTHAQDYCYAEAILLESLTLLRHQFDLVHFQQPYVYIKGAFTVTISMIDANFYTVMVAKNNSILIESLYTKKSLGL